jgi:hypothetical protein
MLRILHLSEGRLPDWRIEKSAISASNLGYELTFDFFVITVSINKRS